jgi:ubiquilin
MQMQQMMRGMNMGAGGSGGGANPFATLMGPGGMGGMGGMGGGGANPFASMMGGGGGGAGTGASALPPEERFRVQLEKLRDMGFPDQQANVAALQATSGNLDAAIDRLLSGI